ncbi:MAG: hypothetical protein ACK4TA_07570 [Saprospiraceae bacterium]
MKTLSFDQMALLEGGNHRGGYISPLCRNALGLLTLAYLLGSSVLYYIALAAAYRFCGGGIDSTNG